MAPEKEKKLTLVIYITAFLIYSVFLYSSLPAGGKLFVANADRGKMVWQQYNCTACHQVYGLGGFLGPDLTNTYSQKGPVYIKAFLGNGTATMPNFHLTGKEVSALLDYMRSLDASGKADPRTFTINKDGTIEQ